MHILRVSWSETHIWTQAFPQSLAVSVGLVPLCCQINFLFSAHILQLTVPTQLPRTTLSPSQSNQKLHTTHQQLHSLTARHFYQPTPSASNICPAANLHLPSASQRPPTHFLMQTTIHILSPMYCAMPSPDQSHSSQRLEYRVAASAFPLYKTTLTYIRRTLLIIPPNPLMLLPSCRHPTITNYLPH